MRHVARTLTGSLLCVVLAGGAMMPPSARAALTETDNAKGGVAGMERGAGTLVWQRTTRYWVRVRTPAGNWVESFDGLAGRRQACSAFTPPRLAGDWCYDPAAEELEEVIDPRNGMVLRSHDAPAYRFAIYCARRAAGVDPAKVINGMIHEAVGPEQCGK